MNTRNDPMFEAKIDNVLARVRAELMRASAKHPPMHSGHEAWGVIDEEFDELKDEIRGNDLPKAVVEAIQLSAMAARFVVDLDPAFAEI